MTDATKLTRDDIVFLERIVDNCRELTSQATSRILTTKAKGNMIQAKKIDKMFDAYFEGWEKMNELSAKLQLMRNK